MNSTINLALDALVNAYKTRHDGCPKMPANNFIKKYLIQNIHNPNLGKMLDEKSTDNIKPSLLISIIRDLIESENIKKQQQNDSQTITEFISLYNSASRILKKSKKDGTRYDTASKRHSAALYELCLIGEAHNEGKRDTKYQNAADRYYVLRAGERCFENGEWVQFKPRTHAAAVDEIEVFFDMTWESLIRAWNRLGIKVSFDADVFPLK